MSIGSTCRALLSSGCVSCDDVTLFGRGAMCNVIIT